jgi:hypothetical protein
MMEQREEVFSKAVRAGKRTYFFDVKTTRANDLYMTITESKKRFDDNGEFRFDKHKIFLYKEDFEKFVEGMEESLAFIKAAFASGEYKKEEPEASDAPEVPVKVEEEVKPSAADVEFEDL